VTHANLKRILGNDRKTQAMKALYLYTWDIHKGKPIDKAEIYKLIDPEPNPNTGKYSIPVYWEEFQFFGALREGDDVKKNRMLLGKVLEQFDGRELCGIRFTIDKSFPRSVTYQFAKI
jgi:hypothetical protein